MTMKRFVERGKYFDVKGFFLLYEKGQRFNVWLRRFGESAKYDIIRGMMGSTTSKNVYNTNVINLVAYAFVGNYWVPDTYKFLVLSYSILQHYTQVVFVISYFTAFPFFMGLIKSYRREGGIMSLGEALTAEGMEIGQDLILITIPPFA